MRPTPPGWPTDLTVTRPRAEVVIDGQTYRAESVQASSQIATDLPPQMRYAPGVTVDNGQARLLCGDEVARRAPMPWKEYWLRELFGKRCTFRMGYGSALVDVLTGQVSDLSGGTDEQAIPLEVSGLGAWMRDPVTVWPMGRINHRTAENPFSGEDMRSELHVGLTSLAVLDILARGAGFHSLPPPDDSTVLYVPAQSTLWPEAGVMVATGFDQVEPKWEAAPWGWGVWPATVVDANYQPAEPPTASEDVWDTQVTVWTTADAGLQLRLIRGAPGTFNRTYLLLVVSPTGVVMTSHPWVGSPAEEIRWDGTIQPGPVTVRFDHTTGITLTLPDGTQVTNARFWNHIGDVRLWGRGAGLTVSRSDAGPLPDPPTLATFTPTFVADPSMAELEVSPFIDGRVRWGVMTEIVSAEGGVLRASGDGTTLRFLNRKTLASQPPVTTIPVRNLASLRWRISAENIYTAVRVGYRPLDVQVADQPRFVVWSPEDPVVLGPRTSQRLFGDLSADAVLGLDRGVEFVTQGWRFVGSTVNTWRSDASGYWTGVTTGQDLSNQVTVQVSQLSPSRVLVEVAWDPPDNPAAGTVVNFTGGPTLRAYQAATWLDDASVKAETGVTLEMGSRELSIPATGWRQTEAAALAWAKDLALEAGTTQPIVEWVELAAPDPRLEAGDVVTVTDPDVTGVRGRALIVDQRLDWSESGGLGHRVALRLLPSTFDDFNAAWGTALPAATIDDFNALWAGKTIDEFNLNATRTE